MTWRVECGDCRTVMAAMEPNSVDAVVCDPPYGLEFMGASWDRLGDIGKASHAGIPDRKPDNVFTRSRQCSHNASANVKCQRCQKWKWSFKGYECKCGTDAEWPNVNAAEGSRMQAWHESWAREAIRVLRPGGFLLAFGGTRTSHRLVCALEDAGFEIRDSLVWIHGQGFPKNLDVERAIAVKTCPLPGRHFAGILPTEDKRQPGDHICPPTPESEPWTGFGTAAKPSHEPICVARKPLAGTVAENVARYGTGALNIDGCRLPSMGAPFGNGTGRHGREFGGGGVNSHERGPWKATAGRWPPNLLLSHHPDCRPTGATRRVKGSHQNGKPWPRNAGGQYDGGFVGEGEGAGYVDADGLETVTEYLCHESCPVRLLDEQAGARRSGGGAKNNRTCTAWEGGAFRPDDTEHEPSVGSASRFFPVFEAAPPLPIEDRWSSEEVEQYRILCERFGNPDIERRGEAFERFLAREYQRGEWIPGVGIKGQDALPLPIEGWYRCEDCGIVRHIDELANGCPRCGETMVPTPDPPLPIEDEPEQDGWDCVEGCPVKALDEQAGKLHARGNVTPTKRRVKTEGWGNIGSGPDGPIDPGDTGGPSRFFPTFPADPPLPIEDAGLVPYRYIPKPSRRERDCGLDDLPAVLSRRYGEQGQGPLPQQTPRTEVPQRNDHSTVKSCALMRWLCRLVCRPGGLILDPFCGSGTTGMAAVLEGFDFVGIEQDEHYAVDLARRRIAHVAKHGERWLDAAAPNGVTGGRPKHAYAAMKTRCCNVCGSRYKGSGPGAAWPACGHDDWAWVEEMNVESQHKPERDGPAQLRLLAAD